MQRIAFAIFASALFAGSSYGAQVADPAAIERAKPKELVVAGDTTAAQRAALLAPVDAFYGFWNNGSAALLQTALAPKFVDHTLPPGRPQGPTGPAAASRGFLAAVPDLSVVVTQRLVVGDRVVSHLRFTSHFTGTFMGHAGS